RETPSPRRRRRSESRCAGARRGIPSQFHASCRYLDQLDGDAVRVADARGIPALVGPPLDQHRIVAAQVGTAPETLERLMQVIGLKRQVRVSDVVGLHVDELVRWAVVLNEL